MCRDYAPNRHYRKWKLMVSHTERCEADDKSQKLFLMQTAPLIYGILEMLLLKQSQCFKDSKRHWSVNSDKAGVILMRNHTSEFELQSYYYVHFQTNTLRSGMNPFIFLSMG